MSFIATNIRALTERPQIRKFIKYSLVSGVSLILTVLLFVMFFGVLKINAELSATFSSLMAALPSYVLNRSWVWSKGGRSHMTKEVIPFWVMVVVGMAFSTGASSLAESFASDVENHALKTFIVTSASVFSFAVLWVGKFVIFNKILFVHREDELEPALDGRTGLPT